MKFEFRSSHRRIIFARVAELVDAHVSGACSERSAGSSPVPGTSGIPQRVQNERIVEFFFYVCLSFGHSLAIFSRNPLASSPRTRNRTHTKPLGHFDFYAAIRTVVSGLNSGKEKYIAEGGKVGRKEGYRKSDEKLQEQYASVIKQLKKGYPIRMIAKNEGVGISTVQRIKKRFLDNVAE